MSEIRERSEKMVAENPANSGKCKYMPLVRDLLAELERVESERNDAMREASSLAKWLNKTYYAQDSPNWGLCDTPAGVITQIDNMITGIPEQARIQAARDCIDEIEGYPTSVSVHVTSHDAKVARETKQALINAIKAHFGIKGE